MTRYRRHSPPSRFHTCTNPNMPQSSLPCSSRQNAWCFLQGAEVAGRMHAHGVPGQFAAQTQPPVAVVAEGRHGPVVSGQPGDVAVEPGVPREDRTHGVGIAGVGSRGEPPVRLADPAGKPRRPGGRATARRDHGTHASRGAHDVFPGRPSGTAGPAPAWPQARPRDRFAPGPAPRATRSPPGSPYLALRSAV